MLDFFKGTVTPKDWGFVGVVLGIAVLLSAGFYFGIYQKKQEILLAEETKFQAKSKELKEAREIREKFDDFKKLAEKQQRLVASFEERLPEESEIPRLIEQFEATASGLGLSVKLEKLATRTDKNKETIPYDITATGGFHDIVQFINLLERHKRYLKVDDLDINEEVGGVSEATFNLSTFRFIQDDSESVASNEPR